MKNKLILFFMLFSAFGAFFSCKSNNEEQPIIEKIPETKKVKYYTITWEDKLGNLGSFINDIEPESSCRNSNDYFCKQILYTDESGKLCAVSPYVANQIKIPENTTVTFQMYGVGDSINKSTVKVTMPDETELSEQSTYGLLISVSIEPISDITLTAHDSKSTNSSGSLTSCDWYITVNEKSN